MATIDDYIELPCGSGRSTARIPRACADQIRDSLSSAGGKAVFWGASWLEAGVSAATVRRGVRSFLGSIGRRDAFELHTCPGGVLIMAAARRKVNLPRAYRANRRRAVQSGIERAAAEGDTVRLRILYDERAAMDAAIWGAGPVVYAAPGRPRGSAV